VKWNQYGKGLNKWQWIGVTSRFIRPQPTFQHSSQTQQGQVFQELLEIRIWPFLSEHSEGSNCTLYRTNAVPASNGD
jgi:hypothetical protein